MAGPMKNRRSQKGAVLILVLFMLSGLAVLSVDLNRDVLLDHVFSSTTRASLTAKPLLASAEVLTALFLVRRNQTASEGGSTEGEESPALRNLAFQAFLDQYNNLLARGSIHIELEDENSRLPLAALFPKYAADRSRARSVGRILGRLVTLLLLRHGYDGDAVAARSRAEDYVTQLLAWGGEGALTGEARTWYRNKAVCWPPGRPPESPDELLLVYWPGVEPALARRVIAGGPDDPGLLDLVSIWSTGPMNINTLKTAVLAALPAAPLHAPAFASAVETARGAQGETLRNNWHRDIFAAWDVPIPGASVLSAASRWFRIRVAAGQGASLLRMESVGWLTNTCMEWVARAIR